MRKNIIIMAIFFLGWSLSAQKLEWHTDAKKAMEIATSKDSPVLMFFTGSDWCGWCTRLEKDVFIKEAFKKWVLKNKIVLLLFDYPKRKKLSKELQSQNAYFQQLFQVRGFPTNHLVKFKKESDSEKVKIVPLGGSFGYAPTVKQWIDRANSCLKADGVKSGANN